MPEGPKLAIVIACHNYEGFVARAIRSVLDQQRDDCELLVVDDGSTDGSWDVISRMKVAAVRIRNSGQRAACLFGLDRTRAPFVLFLDADDELKPGALRAIIDRLDPRVAKLQFPLTRIDGDGDVIGGAHPRLETFRSRDDIARLVLRTGVYTTPPTSGNVFRRDVCDLLRDAGYERAVDGVILFAAPFKGDIVSLSEPLGNYRIHGRNESGLGRTPDVAILQRDMRRFVDRMEHLRAVLKPLRREGDLARAQDVFYFQDLSFRLDVVSGRGPSLGALLRLLRTLLGETFGPKKKFAFAAFFILATLLPGPAAKELLAYRSEVGERSALNLLKRFAAGSGRRRDADAAESRKC